MKKLTLILVCSILAVSAYAQHPIRQYIIHFSPTSFDSDKSLDEVIIKYGDNRSAQYADFKSVILTDAVTLQTILSYTRGNIKSHIQSANRNFGSYEVMVNARTALVTHYYINSRTESKLYFKHLIAMLTAKHADKNVVDELQKIYARVNW